MSFLCCVCVPHSTVRFIESCGRFKTVARPGCNFLMPCVDAIAGGLSLRMQELMVQMNVKTQDDVFIDIIVNVQYRVVPSKVKEAFYELQDPQLQIRTYVHDICRTEIPKMPLAQVFVVKEKLQSAILSALQTKMISFGYEIINTPVTKIDPPAAMKQAMNSTELQKHLKIAADNEGEAKKIKYVKSAEAEAAKIKIEAEAKAEAQHMAGKGVALQRQAIVDGLAESVEGFRRGVDGVDVKDVMDLIILTQYFDTMKDIGKAGANTIFIPHGPGAVNDLGAQLRQGALEANQMRR